MSARRHESSLRVQCNVIGRIVLGFFKASDVLKFSVTAASCPRTVTRCQMQLRQHNLLPLMGNDVDGNWQVMSERSVSIISIDVSQ